jgi:hypothetical protein
VVGHLPERVIIKGRGVGGLSQKGKIVVIVSIVLLIISVVFLIIALTTSYKSLFGWLSGGMFVLSLGMGVLGMGIK